MFAESHPNSLYAKLPKLEKSWRKYWEQVCFLLLIYCFVLFKAERGREKFPSKEVLT
jgi:hypothetical protein